MKKRISLMATGLCTVALLAGPAAAKTCIRIRDIADSQQKDNGRAIIFKMRDGRLLRNDLRGRCPDLVFNGYVWVVRNPDGSVCEDEQNLRVLRSGQICMLGKFTELPSKKKT